MRAILIQEGKIVDIYVLDNNGKNVINDFFDNKLIKNQYKKIIAGFKRIINTISDSGYEDLTPLQFKCWKDKRKKEICELIKGQFRILCFRYEKKLILVKHLIKKRNIEKNEYQNVFKMIDKFNQNPVWE